MSAATFRQVVREILDAAGPDATIDELVDDIVNQAVAHQPLIAEEPSRTHTELVSEDELRERRREAIEEAKAEGHGNVQAYERGDR